MTLAERLLDDARKIIADDEDVFNLSSTGLARAILSQALETVACSPYLAGENDTQDFLETIASQIKGIR